MMTRFFFYSLTLIILFSTLPIVAVGDEIPKGIIVSKSIKKQAITIRSQNTGKRHTYFFNEKTRISSQGSELEFEDLQVGHAVLLDFSRTDLGRELNFIRVPELDDVTPIESDDLAEDLFISGVVTGVRPFKRTVTIHGPKLSQRLTMHIPDSVTLYDQNKKPVKLISLKPGDEVEFRHHETNQGFVVISGEVTKPKRP